VPGGKRRLKHLLTTGLQVGANGQFLTEVLAGSIQLAACQAGSFVGNTAGSTQSTVSTISNLTAAHYFLAQAGSGISPCVALTGAYAGAGSAQFIMSYIAGSGGGAADPGSPLTIDYLAFKLG